MARKYGAGDEIIDTLDDMENCPLPEEEKEAIRFAEKMTLDHSSIEADDVARLKAYWDEDQIVEICCVIGMFNYLNRFAEALGLEPTEPGEGGPNDTAGHR